MSNEFLVKLLNASLYGLGCAFILIKGQCFHLCCLRGSRIVFEGDYPSVEAAKTAFLLRFGSGINYDGLNPVWHAQWGDE